MSGIASRGLRFDVFEVDLRTGELRKHGLRLRLPSQSFQVLALLLEHPGELVTREELREKLWPADTFVDFDHGLNAAVNRLREALGDSADSPKFVETLPRRGYRFIVPVEWNSADSEQPAPDSSAAAASRSELRRGVQDMPEVPVAAPRPSLRVVRFTLALTVVAVVTGVLLLLVLLRPRTRTQPATLRIIPFTTYPGFEAAPSFSPDGNEIAFAWSSEGLKNFDVYVKQIGQERAVRLTHRPAIFLIPAWSPDGRFIAFARRSQVDNDTGIYLLPALGGSERKLSDATPAGSWPQYLLSWSPDGKWLAFSKEDALTVKVDNTSPQRAHIHLLNVETDEQRVLPDPSPDCVLSSEPAFSPDGKYLASVCMLTEDVNKIYVQTPEGGRARELVLVNSSGGGGIGFLEGLAWAADSQSLLYCSKGRLWRVPVGGGKPERLPFAQDAQTPAVAHTGNRLAYSQVSFPANIWRLELTSLTKSASPATKVVSSTRGEWNPQVSPDGRYIAFQSLRSGNSEIWVCDRDGSNPVQLSSFGGPATGSPHWSPDSRHIIFDSRPSGHADLYIVNVDGGQLRRFVTGTPNALAPSWSANGSWIYFATQQPDAIWKVPTEGGTAVRLTKEGRYDPKVSADGTRVFYVVGEHQGARISEQIWSVPTAGGDERLETVMTTNASWAPVQSGIYFIEDAFSGSPGRLTFFDFSNRHVHKVAELQRAGFPGDLGISPDGRTIFYSQLDKIVADIMLVEPFR